MVEIAGQPFSTASGGVINRIFSKVPTKKAQTEVERVEEELMQPIGEEELIEFDGIRRRRTDAVPNRSKQMSTGDTYSQPETAGSQQAHNAWKNRFNARQITLSREEPEAFTTGRRLGGGGIGIVHETILDGIPLALKRTYTRRLTDQQLNEIKILGRISEKRHHHIVELVGSYIHRQRIGYELGVLLWPVAHCDLAAFLHDLDTLCDWLVTSKNRNVYDDDIFPTVETIAAISEIELGSTRTGFADLIFEAARLRLASSIGCTSEAVAYLHDHNIRHKDLKPSQILLSPQGLWVTDFGWSNDISDYTHSTTSDGDRITAKYQTPERVNRQPCGRAEDIFGLGCVFVEMSVHVIPNFLLLRSERPWLRNGWSFQANLDEINHLFDTAASVSNQVHWRLLGRLMVKMLAYNPKERPTIEAVLNDLSQCSGLFFGNCCQRLDITNDKGESPEIANVKHRMPTHG
jgi:serine/threonine protein kinase